MDPFYQIENNIPSDKHLQTVTNSNKAVLYLFVKGTYTNYMDLDDLTSDWSLRGYNSRASDEVWGRYYIWGNENNGWRNWSYYYYTGSLESRPLAESILYQYLNTLKNNGTISDFRIRYNFIEE